MLARLHNRFAKIVAEGLSSTHSRRTRRLSLECCEDRNLFAVFTVTSSLDTNGVGELRTAVASANFNPGLDTIVFDPNVTAVLLGLGEIQVTDELIIDGTNPNAAATTIGTGNSSRIFRVDDANPSTSFGVTMKFLNLKDGNASVHANPVGGAVLNRERLFMENSRVTNSLAVDGGGIANFGRLRLDNMVIEHNSANGRGGGVSTQGTTAVTEAIGSRIANNFANTGGGMAAVGGALLTTSNTAIVGNTAQISGGGLAVVGASRATIVNTDINQNNAGIAAVQPALGGGVYSTDNSSVVITGSRISSNGQAIVGLGVSSGGGIYSGFGTQLTVRNSEVSLNVANRGGGIAAVGNDSGRATVTLSDSTIENNSARQVGGGLDLGERVSLTTSCLTVSNNSSTISGGGIQMEGASAPSQIVATITDSTITGNSTGQRGAGILSVKGVELDVVNSVISDNASTGHGGGFFLAGRDPTADGINRTTITQSLISNNEAANPGVGIAILRSGGGIWVGADAQLEIDNSTIQRNEAETNGGGVANFAAGRMTIRNSTLSGNTAGIDGGGISVDEASAAVFQSTLAGNRAGHDGGGIWLKTPVAGALDLDHVTISRNLAAASGIAGGGVGGGLALFGTPNFGATVHLGHTIVSNNLNLASATNDEIFDDAAASGISQVVPAFSLIRDNLGTALTPGNPDPSGNLIGTAAFPIDARLNPLGHAGGTTATMVPMLGSPVINAGNPMFAGPPLGDQRLLPYDRIFGGRIDIGAVEVQPPPPDPDFNHDGVANCSDVDALVVAIVSGLNPAAFDLTGEGQVNRADLVKWLDDAPIINGLAIKHYLPGDANLDTFVDGVDFGIWNANKFTFNPSWCRGDFNADGFVDGVDFGIWNANKFTQSPPLDGCGYLQDNRLPADRNCHGGSSDDLSADQNVKAIDEVLATYNAPQPAERQFHVTSDESAVRKRKAIAAATLHDTIFSR